MPSFFLEKRNLAKVEKLIWFSVWIDVLVIIIFRWGGF